MKTAANLVKVIGATLLVAALAGLRPPEHSLAAAPRFSPVEARPWEETPDKPASPSASWHALGSGLNGWPCAIAVDGTDVYAGGGFTNAGGNSDADYIARWDGASWHALGSVVNDIVNDGVEAIAVDETDLYVGGELVDAGGIPGSNGIARWDGASWHALGSGLHGRALAITVDGTDVYAGGDFTNAGGNSDAHYIARWDGASWHALGSGLNDMVLAIAVDGTDVYAGGGFTNAGGNSDADYIARWDGASWHALGSGLNGWVYAIAVAGTDLYVGGFFTNAGGNSDADYIARWDGASWHALGSVVNDIVNDGVEAIAVDGTDVYAGGYFTNAGGYLGADYIARWDGVSWHALGSGLNSWPCAIAVDGTDVYAGGDFTNAGGNSDADYIARWGPPDRLYLPLVVRQ
jgi:trimeric autotransporter adhesin